MSEQGESLIEFLAETERDLSRRILTASPAELEEAADVLEETLQTHWDNLPIRHYAIRMSIKIGMLLHGYQPPEKQGRLL